MSKNYHTDNKTFMMYKDWEKFFNSLSDAQAGKLIKAVFAFVARAEEPTFKESLNILFLLMKDTFERDGKKWEEKCNCNSQNIKKRWSKNTDEYDRIRTSTKTYNQIQADTKNTDIDTDIDKEIDKEIDNIPPISPKGDKPEDSFSESFNDFWKAYPKKVSKATALKAWNKLKPNDDLVREILSALERQKTSVQWQKDNGQFIPYPATWLNGRRWEDECGVSYKKEMMPKALPLGKGGGHTDF